MHIFQLLHQVELVKTFLHKILYPYIVKYKLEIDLLLHLGAWDSRIRLAKKAFGLDESDIALLSQLAANEVADYEGLKFNY